MHTGENEQGLRKIIDLTRWISIFLLLLHFYHECYGSFRMWNWHTTITDNLLKNIVRTGLLHPLYKAKVAALFFLAISLLGTRARKEEGAGYKQPLVYLLTGFLLYFLSGLVLRWSGHIHTITLAYMVTTSLGLLLILSGG